MATVKDILDRKGRDVATIGPEATAREAAHAMSDRRIGSLVVTDAGRTIGIVTERDIMSRIVGRDRDPSQTAVSEIMTRELSTCELETAVPECLELMIGRRIRRLPVIDGCRLVGIITSGDVMRQELEEQKSTIGYLSAYMEQGPTPTGAAG